MTKLVQARDVVDLNPSIPRTLLERPEMQVSFLPMASVGEDGTYQNGQHRSVQQVLKGFTYFANGDVIVAKITPCLQNGKAALLRNLKNGHGFGSTEFHVLRPGPDIDAQYLFYMIWNPAFRHHAVRRFTGSAGQQRVPVDAVADFEFPLPPLAEQKRIAAILDKADAIRRRRREATRLTDQLIPSIFYEMFGEWLVLPVSKMQRLGDPELAEVVSGVTKGRRFNGQPTTMVPYIRVANVQDGFLNLSEIKTIEVLPQDVESLRLQRGDILMTEGGDFDKLGRGAIWNHDIPDCIHQNHVFRVRCSHQKLLPEFFANYIRMHIAREYFLRCAKKTSNLASINMTQLRDLPVPTVPIEHQKRFVADTHVIRHMKLEQESSGSKANDLVASLVQRAFRGKL